MTSKLPQRYILGVLALALVIRVAAAFYLGNDVSGLSGAQDEVSYSMLGERFATGHGLTFPEGWYPWIHANAPQSYYSATMSLYLAAIYKAFGYQPLVARIITSVLSAFIVLMIILVAQRIFGKKVALLAGVIASCYAYLVFYGATLVTETPFILSLLLAIYLAYSIVDDPSPRKWIFLGVALASSVLFRQAVTFYVPLLLLWIIVGRREQKKMAFIPVAIIILFVLPFTIRNYVLWHRFLLLESQFGHVFWDGNHPGQELSFYGTLVFPVPSSVLASHNDAEITNTLLLIGVQNVLRNPGNFVVLSLSRLVELYTFWPTADSTFLANLMRVVSAAVVLPLGFVGLVLSRRRWWDLMPILLFILVHTVVYSSSWAMIRYRIPVDAVLIPFASLVLYKLCIWIRRDRGVPQAAHLERVVTSGGSK